MATASQVTVSPFFQLLRISLILINIIFWVTGVCLFVIGIWATVKLNKYEELPRPNHYDGVSIVVIIIGLAIACIGICGCCGAMRKNVCLLKTFCLFLGIIIICEMCVAIAGYAYRKEIKGALSNGLSKSMKDYKDDGSISTAWNTMQKAFDCCGKDNYTDWFNVNWDKQQEKNNTSVPESCCKDESETCNIPEHVRNATIAETYINREGCYNQITNFFQQKFSVLASGALSIAIIQFLSIVFAYCFWNHVQNKANYELM